MKKMTLPSEIKGKGALSAFAAIIDPLCNLVEGEETSKLYDLAKDQERSGTSIQAQMIKILSKNEEDFCRIMAVCYGTTPEKYAEGLTLGSVLDDFSRLLCDRVWLDFFSAAQAGAKRAGSAPENTPESKA